MHTPILWGLHYQLIQAPDDYRPHPFGHAIMENASKEAAKTLAYMGRVTGEPSFIQGTLSCIVLSGYLGKGWVGVMGDKSCYVMVPWQDGRDTIVAVYLL